jgi:hypothetical protein
MLATLAISKSATFDTNPITPKTLYENQGVLDMVDP